MGAMAERKTPQERLSDIDKRMNQLKAQKKALETKTKSDERKKRTRRLIQNGALAEQYFNCTNIEPEQFELLLKQITAIDAVKNITNKEI